MEAARAVELGRLMSSPTRRIALLLPLALVLALPPVAQASIPAPASLPTPSLGVSVFSENPPVFAELPFGEECLTPPCTPIQGTNTRKFTGKERDAETGLDYFGARYDGSRIGRFITADPRLNIQASLTDPQRWNRYAYGLNNPLRVIDPDGREPVKNQMGTAAAAVRAMTRVGVTSLSPELASANNNPFRGAPGARGAGPGAKARYVPAKNVPGNFVDMQHFLAAAAKAHEIGMGLVGVAAVMWGGRGLEANQAYRGWREDNPGLSHSALSYEDIPSNDAGAHFGGQVYDPSQPLGPQVEAFLVNELGAMSPSEFRKQYPEQYGLMPANERSSVREYEQKK